MVVAAIRRSASATVVPCRLGDSVEELGCSHERDSNVLTVRGPPVDDTPVAPEDLDADVGVEQDHRSTRLPAVRFS
jgi:hypothetical protein